MRKLYTATLLIAGALPLAHSAHGEEVPETPICDRSVEIGQCAARIDTSGADWLILSSAPSCSVVEWGTGTDPVTTLVIDSGARVRASETGAATPAVRSCTVVVDSRIDPQCYELLSEFDTHDAAHVLSRIEEMTGLRVEPAGNTRTRGARRFTQDLIEAAIDKCNIPIDPKLARLLMDNEPTGPQPMPGFREERLNPDSD